MDALEEELRASLADAAELVPIPRCDARLLAAEGRRAAHRSRVHKVWWSVAGVAAALAVVVGSTAIVRLADDDVPAQPADHTPTAPPNPPAPLLTLANLPHGAAPLTPYWVDGRLHVGTQSRAMQAPDTAVTAGGSTLLTRSVAGGYQIEMLRGLDATVLGTASSQPVLSADGQYAAWETDLTGQMKRVELWELTNGTMVDSATYRSQAHCCDAPSIPVGIDARTRVYIEDGGRPLVWRNRAVPSGPAEILLVDHDSLDLTGAWSGGPIFAMVTDESERGRSVLGTLDRVNGFHRSASYPSESGVWSHNGTSVAFTGADGSVTAYDVDTQQAMTVPLTRGSNARVTWESDDSLLLHGITASGRTYWLRYDVAQRSLEIAAEFPAAADVVVPESR